MTEKLITLRIRLIQAIETRAARDAGQGSLEYIGAILVAAVVVVAVLEAFDAVDVTGAVTDAVDAVTNPG